MVDQELLSALSEMLDRKLDEKLNAMEERFDEKLNAMGQDFDKKLSVRDNHFNDKFAAIDRKLDKMNEQIKELKFRQGKTHRGLRDLSLDLKVAERNISREIHNLHDQMDTVVQVLKQNEFIL